MNTNQDNSTQTMPEYQNVKKMSTKELVDEFNTLTGKKITKFVNRLAAEEQVRQARTAIAARKPNMSHTHQHKDHQNKDHQHKDHATKQAEQATSDQAPTTDETPVDVIGEQPKQKTLAEMSDAEVLAAAEALVDKKEITLEDALVEEAAMAIKDGKKRTGKAKPVVEKQPKAEMTDEELEAHKLSIAEKIASGVSTSWTDSEVRAARIHRVGCIISWKDAGGEQHEHKSNSFFKIIQIL